MKATRKHKERKDPSAVILAPERDDYLIRIKGNSPKHKKAMAYNPEGIDTLPDYLTFIRKAA